MDYGDQDFPPPAAVGAARGRPRAETTAAPGPVGDPHRQSHPSGDEDPLTAIPLAVRRCEVANRDLVALVARARLAGASWALVGSTLGVSRQAAWVRFACNVGHVAPGNEDFRPIGP